MNDITGNGNNRCGIPTYRISTALMSSNGNIHISNRKQSYNMNTGTWNNNTCNKHGDPYDKKIETTQVCATVICKHDMHV